MRSQRKPRGRGQRVLLFAIALASLYGGYYWGTQHRPATDDVRLMRALAAPRPLASFELFDHHGEPFTAASLKDHWNLVFVGYARGEETEVLLALASRVGNRLAAAPDLQRSVRAVLLSVDPDHDTVDALRQFMSRHDERFVALTGAPDQIRGLADQLGAEYRARDPRGSADGHFDHSTGVALVDPDGALLGLFTGVVDPGGIAENIKLLAEERQP